MRRTSRGSSTCEKCSSSAARRDFRGKASAGRVIGRSESGAPHRFSKSTGCQLSYKFGALRGFACHGFHRAKEAYSLIEHEWGICRNEGRSSLLGGDRRQLHPNASLKSPSCSANPVLPARHPRQHKAARAISGADNVRNRTAHGTSHICLFASVDARRTGGSIRECPPHRRKHPWTPALAEASVDARRTGGKRERV